MKVKVANSSNYNNRLPNHAIIKAQFKIVYSILHFALSF